MDQESIIRQCAALHDKALVRALTLDKTEYSDPFRVQARRELDKRGLSLSAVVDVVEVRRPESDPVYCNIHQALAVLDEDIPLWDMRIFANCMNESMVLQRETQQWMAHHYRDEEYARSFSIKTREALSELLPLFLRLEEWEHRVDLFYDLDEWDVFEKSNSRGHIAQIVADLDAGQVPCTVQTPAFSQDEEGALTLLVPPEYMDLAEEIIADVEEDVHDLYHRVAVLAAGHDLKKELETYDLLLQAAPTNPAVFYNRGSILHELGRYREAADAFIEAVSLGVEEAEKNAQFESQQAPRGLGGIFGMVAFLFRKTLSSSDLAPERPRYPDFIDDAELFLRQLVERMPRDLKILHCLASISRLKNQVAEAEELYKNILAIEPSDRIAYFYLGYLHSARGGEGRAPTSA